MLTHLVKSINWIDVGLLILFIWIVFIAVKNGFVAEFFKSLGIVIAVFVSLHFYSPLAGWLMAKTHSSWPYWDLLVFVDLWFMVVFFFKYVREGVLLLFKVETNHQGFDKYAAGVVAVGRGILICSLTMFLVLLIHNGYLTRMTINSHSFKVAGKAAVATYSFLYKNLVERFCSAEHYNAAAAQVAHSK